MGVGCLLALTCVALVLPISGVGSAFRLGCLYGDLWLRLSWVGCGFTVLGVLLINGGESLLFLLVWLLIVLVLSCVGLVD